MRSAMAILGVAAMSLLVTGCGPTWSVFEFDNVSDEKIWVDDLGPLDRSPPCGNLGPGPGSATAYMAAQEIPRRLVVTWRVVPEGMTRDQVLEEQEWTSTEVEIQNLDELKKHDYLKLTYRGGGEWHVRFSEEAP